MSTRSHGAWPIRLALLMHAALLLTFPAFAQMDPGDAPEQGVNLFLREHGLVGGHGYCTTKA